MSLLPGNGTIEYTGKQAMDLIIRPALTQGNLEDYFKIVLGVKQRDQVIYMNPLNYVTVVDPGCGAGESPALATRTQKLWEPDPLKSLVTQCYVDLKGSIYEQDLKGGDERSNLEGTLAEEHMLGILEPAQMRDTIRIAFLADKAITAGQLTRGNAALKDYNQTDGILKRIKQGVTAGLIPRTVITENAGANAVAQKITTDAALAYLDAVYYGANPVLKQVEVGSKAIYVTRGIYEGYERYLRAEKTLESAYAKLQNGQTVLMYNGIQLIILNALDQFLAADFTLAGATTTPNWIIYTSKDNMQLGMDADIRDGQALRVWEDIDTELYKARMKYLMATMIGLEEYMSVGF